MLNLVPTEAWKYDFIDIIRLLSVIFSQRNPDKKIFIQGIGNCIPTRSARTAIIIALKTLNFPPGARIGVPLYCCPVVFKAIRAVGYSPQFIDSDPRSFCISREDLFKKSIRLDALIAVHMFGIVSDMLGLLEVMNGKPIIEDCAQSLGSSIDRRPAGSFGTISVFSFRLGKYLSAGEGGALFSKDQDIFLRMSQLAADLPLSTRFEELKHVFENYIRSKFRSKPLWGFVGHSIWDLYNKKVDFAAKSPIILNQIFKSDLATIQNRMVLLGSMIKANRTNAEYYIRNLKLNPNMLYQERSGNLFNRFMFPITFRSSKDCDAIAAYLLSQQISSAKPYKEVIEGAAKHYGYKGDCPMAEQLLRRTLVIPSHYKLKKSDMHRIAQCVNAGWARIINHG